jgi:hypothetical protein
VKPRRRIASAAGEAKRGDERSRDRANDVSMGNGYHVDVRSEA